jgi:hypothetical protein
MQTRQRLGPTGFQSIVYHASQKQGLERRQPQEQDLAL